MLGKPQDARLGSESWAGLWRPGGRMSAVRVVAALTMTCAVAITVAPRLLARPCRLLGSLPLTSSQREKIGGGAAGWAAIQAVAQFADRAP
jgi:hypothetical protein